MARFLLDENISRPFADALRQRGHEVRRAKEVGLRASIDEAVFAYAVQHNCILVTNDRGFGNPKRHPLHAPHRGVIIAQFPNDLPYSMGDQELLKMIDGIDMSTLESSLLLVKIGQSRRKNTKIS